MARYHFNLSDGEFPADTQGVELHSLDLARQEALKRAGSLLSDAPDTFWSDPEWRLDVSDEAGMILFSLTIYGSDAPVLGGLQR